ncbi:UBX domain-containing Tether [Echinococcus granulosus]|uniref:UBX domain-containing Tether n=1 Tax=Echinococcus granulosus TaxID=6210 RepID=W6U337_ECHGR|nr:UBX domain-containing Tether [Echinococcus granulosus]EUB55498.1 UBX domain-containing Tether [Echinococcus granulosus]
MSFLNIRYPTGHLEVFPVKAQAPLIKVFEAACAKRSLDPKAHKLVHKRRTVDLSLPFQYSGLTNRATLELVAYEEGEAMPIPSTSTVRIGIRLEDSHRVEWSGCSSSSIWSILETLASQDKRIAALLTPTADGLVPTVIYLQNQIGGEASLRDTTLDSLGIRGSALFQLHSGPPQPVKSVAKGSPHVPSLPAGASSPTTGTEQPSGSPSSPGKKPPHSPASQHSSPSASVAGTRQLTCEQHLSQGESTFMSPSGSSSGGAGTSDSSSPPAKKPPPPPASQHQSPPAPVAGTSQPPYKQHLPQGESASIIFPSGSGSTAGAGTSPTLEPFSIFTSASSRSLFDPDESAREHPKKSPTVGEMIGVSLEPDVATSSQQGAMREHIPKFKFPTETEGRNLLHPEEAGGSAEMTSGACEREEVLFRRQTSVSHDTESEELPDEYFQLTERELRLIISDLRKEAGTDVLLGERSVQRSARSALIENSPRCIIRFTWSDDICLQACFRPQEHVSALYDFIRERLANRDLSFQLFTTPPRVVLSNMDETLIQAHLVPMARVHMTSQNVSSRARDVLRADLLANMKSDAEAADISAKWVPKSPNA